MKNYKFLKEGRDWYIDLPDYIGQGGSRGDLQMVDGADTMLDIMAVNSKVITLMIDRKPFNGANVLNLRERCDPLIGGAYYELQVYEGEAINKTMWLCGVTEFVFGDLPEQIYIKRIPE